MFKIQRYANCYDQLSLTDVRKLFGPPHIEDEDHLFYFCNVRYCGQHFDGFRLKKGNDDRVTEIKPYVKEDIFPNDESKEFEVRCRSVDYIDPNKMRINQGFFEYFSEDLVEKNFEAASFIDVQPKYENESFTERCLETVRYGQYNFLYNNRKKYYIENYSYQFSAFPLLGHDDEEYKNCQIAMSTAENIISAFGTPTFISESRDTLVYIAGNRTNQGSVPHLAYLWSTKFDRYLKSNIKGLDQSYMPKTTNDCDRNPVP